ncbi:MAG: hypothetical protein ABFD60_04375 [Bryobacteraceae bacterium]
MANWRVASLEVINQVIAENPGANEKELRKLASNAYPFGSRTHHPYKAWLKAMEEVFGPSEAKVRAVRRKEQIEAALSGQFFLEVTPDG